MSNIDSDTPDLQPIFRLLQIYKSHGELQFPGVSAESLTQATAGIDDQVEEIERLEFALVEAREALVAKHQSVIELARQAHAYATLFANAPSRLSGTDSEKKSETLAELREELAAIQLDDAAKSGRKRRPQTRIRQTTTPPPVVDEPKHSPIAAQSNAAE